MTHRFSIPPHDLDLRKRRTLHFSCTRCLDLPRGRRLWIGLTTASSGCAGDPTLPIGPMMGGCRISHALGSFSKPGDTWLLCKWAAIQSISLPDRTFCRLEDQSHLQACIQSLTPRLDNLRHSMLRWLSVLTQILVLEASNLPRPPQGVTGVR